MSKRAWSNSYSADDDGGVWSYEISAETRDGVEHIGFTVRDSTSEITVELDAYNAAELRARLTDAIAHVGGTR